MKFNPQHPANFSPVTGRPLHPYCHKCGWRKGGIDSWDGTRCKCGHMSASFVELCEFWNTADEALQKAKNESPSAR